MNRLIALATLVVIGLVLFGLPRCAEGAEQNLEPAAREWQKTPGRPSQRYKELGESAGDIRLTVERNRGNVLYILMKRCVKDKQFYSLGWQKGALSATGYSCEGRHLYSTDTSFWEKRGGELPEALREELKNPNPQKRTKKS